MATAQLAVLDDVGPRVWWSVELSQQLTSIMSVHHMSDKEAAQIAGVSYRTIERMRKFAKAHTETNICRVYLTLGLEDSAIQGALSELSQVNPLKYERLRRGVTTRQVAMASGVSVSLLFDGQTDVQPVSAETWARLESAWETFPLLASQSSPHGATNIIRFTTTRRHRQRVSQRRLSRAIKRAIQFYYPNGELPAGVTHKQQVQVLEKALDLLT